ncbi:hypothetical protein Csa_023087, partial [Cucumis sativus]
MEGAVRASEESRCTDGERQRIADQKSYAQMKCTAASRIGTDDELFSSNLSSTDDEFLGCSGGFRRTERKKKKDVGGGCGRSWEEETKEK